MRAYGQQDPLVEYKKEGHRLFNLLLQNIDNTIVDMLLKVELKQGPVPEPQQSVIENRHPAQRGKSRAKLGRNDPCPCGKINPETGKPIKYKKCCYPKYG